MPVIYFDPARHEATFSYKKLLGFFAILTVTMVLGLYTLRSSSGGTFQVQSCDALTPSTPILQETEESWFIEPASIRCPISENPQSLIDEFSLGDTHAIQSLLENYYENLDCLEAKFFVQGSWHNAGYDFGSLCSLLSKKKTHYMLFLF